MGSVMFTSGSYFWLYNLNNAQSLALVDWPFFIGSIVFNAAAYISWWQTLNLKDPPPPKTIWWSFKDRDLSWASLPWWMGVFGGVGFTLAGALEMVSHKFWKW